MSSEPVVAWRYSKGGVACKLETVVPEPPAIGIALSENGAIAGLTVNRPGQVLFASLIGTTIEFFDFYIYATAAVLVFPRLFFPASDPASATLASLATFAIAFLARPFRSALFGHFC